MTVVSTQGRFGRVINNDLRKRVGLRKLYPYSVVQGLSVGGARCAGCAYTFEGALFLNADLIGAHAIESVYLHEVGHLIAASAGIDDDPEGRMHNRYFACLVGVMYRRAGLMDRLQIYDFGDTHNRQSFLGETHELPPDGELISRFAYIIRRSAQLAPMPLTIEQIAAKIYQEDVFPAWTETKPRKRAGPSLLTWAQGFVVGLSAAIAAFIAFLAWR